LRERKSFSWDKRLLLLRHGEATGNTRGAFLGRRDDPLTDRGRAQAHHLVDLLAEESVDRIYASPLLRARETATPLAEARGLDLIVEPALIEQDFGDWDGLTFGEVREIHPDDFTAWWRDAVRCPPSGGEHLGAVTRRVETFLGSLLEDLGRGETAVLVGHGSASQALMCVLFGIETRSMWPFRLQNGTLTEVQITAGLPSLTRMSVS